MHVRWCIQSGIWLEKEKASLEFQGGFLVSGKGTWTPDRTDMSRLLYQLSYAAVTTLAL